MISCGSGRCTGIGIGRGGGILLEFDCFSLDFLMVADWTARVAASLLLGEVVAERQRSRRPCRVELRSARFVRMEGWYPDDGGFVNPCIPHVPGRWDLENCHR